MNKPKVQIKLKCAYCKQSETISVYPNVLHSIKFNPGHPECKRLGNRDTMRKIRKRTRPSSCYTCRFEKPCQICVYMAKDKLDIIKPEQAMRTYRVSRRSVRYDLV